MHSNNKHLSHSQSDLSTNSKLMDYMNIVLWERPWKQTLTLKPLPSSVNGICIAAQTAYCRPKVTWIDPFLLTWGGRFTTPPPYLNSTRDGRSIPGYVLCMVSPLHARAFNLKMQRAANTQHPHKCPHRNGKFGLCPRVWPQQFPHFCQSNLRLFIICCTIYQVQAY